jgi:branched-chain amino acid transport system ATP-binding protein
VSEEPTAAPLPPPNDSVPGPVAGNDSLLELRNVSAGYGPFRAVFDVSLNLHEGKVLALLGSNGAGKTTVARIASGLVRPSEGGVFFEGVRIDRLKTYRIARLGIVHAPEGRSVFATLSVEENLSLAFRREFGRSGVNPALQRAYELFPRLGERRKQVAGTLSGGEQRMLSLARVLVHPPRLLIADELSLGLAPIVVEEVYRTLATVRDSGTAILIVEQHVGHALALADEVAVLNKGRVVYGGPVDELGDLSEWLLPAAREDTAAELTQADLNGSQA